MSYPPYGTGQMLAHLMPYPIRHGSRQNALHFPATLLDRPIKRSSAELEQWLSHFPFDPMEPQSSDSRHVELVERVLRSALERNTPLPSAKAIAARLAISVGTLRRRLEEEGSSLRAIKRQCRMDAAKRLLADPHPSISEVARLTDYADFTALSRAFRGAFGLSPSGWRKEHLLRANLGRQSRASGS